MLTVTEHGAVTQILLGREVDGTVYYWTAAYLVDGLLIDTGCAYTASELAAFLRDKRIDRVINTHHHEDHVGGNALLQKERGVMIAAHPLAVPLIKTRPVLKGYQEMVWGYPDPSAATPAPDMLHTAAHTFRILHTPGHCADHLAVLEPDQGWCFCGDLFVSEEQKVFRADEDIAGITTSLRMLLDLPLKQFTLFTSIGRIYEQGREAIGAFLSHMGQVKRRVLELKPRELDTVAIRDAIFGRESGLAALTEGHYSIENLIRKLIDLP